MSEPTIHHTSPDVTLWHGDCIETMRLLPDASVDAVVTDPPYGLGFMGKEWDDLPPGLDFAVEALRVLKPGGHLLAFGGTRTWHRLAVAVEDAGFEIRDSIAWLYGSGFPKSMDVSKAIDKRPGVTQHAEFAAALTAARQSTGMLAAEVSEKVVGSKTGACWNWEHHQFPDAKWWPALRDLLGMDGARWDEVIAEAERIKTGERTTGLGAGKGGTAIIGDSSDRSRYDKATTPEAEKWQGWGTALKPAFEPIIVGRKPLVGTVASNVLVHGTGALNIDASRTATTDKLGGGAETATTAAQKGHEGWTRPWMGDPDAQGAHAARVRANVEKAQDLGRWPTNVLLDSTQADALDTQTGVLTSGANPKRRGADGSRTAYGEFAGQEDANPQRGANSGGASRFFPTFRYEAKAKTAERPVVDGVAHPTVKPIALMRWLITLVTPTSGTVLEPFAGSGTTVEACILDGFKVIAVERGDEYLPLIEKRIARGHAAVEAEVERAASNLTLFDLGGDAA